MGFTYAPSVVLNAREHLIEEIRNRDTKGTVIGAEQIADWLIGQDYLGPAFYAQFVDEEEEPSAQVRVSGGILRYTSDGQTEIIQAQR